MPRDTVYVRNRNRAELLDGNLFRLRHETYRAAASFYGLLARYYSVSKMGNGARGLTQEIIQTGMIYCDALDDLHEYLQSLPPTDLTEEETNKVGGALEWLDFEMQRFKQ